MQTIDIHSHVLPGVDDGAKTPAETKAMLLAMRQAGITEVVATPHIKTTHPNTVKIRQIYQSAKPLFQEQGVALRLGYEVNCRVVLEAPEKDVHPYCIEGTNVVLLEPSCQYLPMQWENNLRDIQGRGMDIIIAHPERCGPIQEDLGIAARMVEIGCELQLSANFISGGMFSKERKCAQMLLKQGLISYIASDAHSAGDYGAYVQAQKRWGALVKPGVLLARQ